MDAASVEAASVEAASVEDDVMLEAPDGPSVSSTDQNPPQSVQNVQSDSEDDDVPLVLLRGRGVRRIDSDSDSDQGGDRGGDQGGDQDGDDEGSVSPEHQEENLAGDGEEDLPVDEDIRER